MTQQYPDNFEFVSNKLHELGYDNLTEREKMVYTLWWFEGELNNGGFHQYFFNSSGDHANQALTFLENIGAVQVSRLLKEAIKTAFGDLAPVERSERQELLDIDEEKKMEQLDQLDQVFYEIDESITQLLNVFWQNNT